MLPFLESLLQLPHRSTQEGKVAAPRADFPEVVVGGLERKEKAETGTKPVKHIEIESRKRQ